MIGRTAGQSRQLTGTPCTCASSSAAALKLMCTWSCLLIYSLYKQVCVIALRLVCQAAGAWELLMDTWRLISLCNSHLWMHHIMLHQRNHLASDAVQLSIHDRKPFQYIWPARIYKIIADV